MVVIRDQEMVVRCPTYFQAVKWARMECKSYKIPEPDHPDDEEADDLPLFLRSDFLHSEKKLSRLPIMVRHILARRE